MSYLNKRRKRNNILCPSYIRIYIFTVIQSKQSLTVCQIFRFLINYWLPQDWINYDPSATFPILSAASTKLLMASINSHNCKYKSVRLRMYCLRNIWFIFLHSHVDTYNSITNKEIYKQMLWSVCRIKQNLLNTTNKEKKHEKVFSLFNLSSKVEKFSISFLSDSKKSSDLTISTSSSCLKSHIHRSRTRVYFDVIQTSFFQSRARPRSSRLFLS